MTPNGIFPGVGSFVFLLDNFLVYHYAQAGPLGQGGVAVHKREILLIVHKVQYAAPHIVMDSNPTLYRT